MGRALEVMTLKVYMKQREKEEYIDQVRSSLSFPICKSIFERTVKGLERGRKLGLRILYTS